MSTRLLIASTASCSTEPGGRLRARRRAGRPGGPHTFKGKVKIKVGPVTVAYDGLARTAERDDARRTAILEAEGRETTAPGSARSRSTMAAVPNGSGSTVRVSTEFTVAGRAATFGRGLTMAKPPRRYSRLGLAN